jgi:hypothetical protein
MENEMLLPVKDTFKRIKKAIFGRKTSEAANINVFKLIFL